MSDQRHEWNTSDDRWWSAYLREMAYYRGASPRPARGAEQTMLETDARKRAAHDSLAWADEHERWP